MPSLPSQRPQLTQMMSPVFEAAHLTLDTLEGDITPAHHAGHRLTSKIEAGGAKVQHGFVHRGFASKFSRRKS